METPFILDIGGEGRHPTAWNLNPRATKTLGPDRGEPIPRLIRGRGESIPLPDRSVDVVIVEQTPLQDWSTTGDARSHRANWLIPIIRAACKSPYRAGYFLARDINTGWEFSESG
jgi:hypothetical protein